MSPIEPVNPQSQPPSGSNAPQTSTPFFFDTITRSSNSDPPPTTPPVLPVPLPNTILLQYLSTINDATFNHLLTNFKAAIGQANAFSTIFGSTFTNASAVQNALADPTATFNQAQAFVTQVNGSITSQNTNINSYNNNPDSNDTPSTDNAAVNDMIAAAEAYQTAINDVEAAQGDTGQQLATAISDYNTAAGNYNTAVNSYNAYLNVRDVEINNYNNATKNFNDLVTNQYAPEQNQLPGVTPPVAQLLSNTITPLPTPTVPVAAPEISGNTIPANSFFPQVVPFPNPNYGPISTNSFLQFPYTTVQQYQIEVLNPLAQTALPLLALATIVSNQGAQNQNSSLNQVSTGSIAQLILPTSPTVDPNINVKADATSASAIPLLQQSAGGTNPNLVDLITQALAQQVFTSVQTSMPPMLHQQLNLSLNNALGLAGLLAIVPSLSLYSSLVTGLADNSSIFQVIFGLTFIQEINSLAGSSLLSQVVQSLINDNVPTKNLSPNQLAALQQQLTSASRLSLLLAATGVLARALGNPGLVAQLITQLNLPQNTLNAVFTQANINSQNQNDLIKQQVQSSFAQQGFTPEETAIFSKTAIETLQNGLINPPINNVNSQNVNQNALQDSVASGLLLTRQFNAVTATQQANQAVKSVFSAGGSGADGGFNSASDFRNQLAQTLVEQNPSLGNKSAQNVASQAFLTPNPNNNTNPLQFIPTLPPITTPTQLADNVRQQVLTALGPNTSSTTSNTIADEVVNSLIDLPSVPAQQQSGVGGKLPCKISKCNDESRFTKLGG